MEKVGLFYGYLEYFTAVWCILWPLSNALVIWYFFSVLVYCAEKNLAALDEISSSGFAKNP
jgi:hypothetical protein